MAGLHCGLPSNPVFVFCSAVQSSLQSVSMSLESVHEEPKDICDRVVRHLVWPVQNLYWSLVGSEDR